MASENVIRVLFKPRIELEELSEPDGSYGSANVGPLSGPSGVKSQELTGKFYPLIVINDVTFSPKDIINFELDTTDFLPTVNIKVRPGTGSLGSFNAPVDGDIIKVFVRSSSEVIKPVRIDFLITEIGVSTSNKYATDLTDSIMSVSGKMNVPHLYDEVNIAIDGTSFDALQKLAEELGLGFSTNVSSTDDAMKWVCPFNTREKFMKDIVDAAWSSQNEFYMAFIDVYYNLNFIEVNTLLKDAPPFEGESASFMNPSYSDVGSAPKNTVKKMLSNHSNAQGSPYAIKSYKPINKASDLSRKYGYVYKMKFFDYSSMKLFDFNIEPLATEGSAQSKVLMKGKAHDNSYLDQSRTNYVGIQYPDNMHEMYYYAKMHNLMNIIEIDKMNVSASLYMYNLNFIRGEYVPVVIFIGANDPSDSDRAMLYEDKNLEKVGGEEPSQNMKPTMDKFYSGNYILKGFKLIFKKGYPHIEEEMILAKREWEKQYT